MELSIFIYVGIGFFAQMIDGALGMGYGVSSTSFLLGVGISPVSASASVHAAELFTTAISGLSHLRLGNVERGLFKRLLVPGVIGGMIGAYLLSEFPGKTIKPFIAIYLMVMGGLILYKAIRGKREEERKTRLVPIGFVGGFFDAVGGGGWGPIVTTTLIANGKTPRLAIGSVNLAEFFVTASQSLVFILTIGLHHWKIILGLMMGGAMAAPLAAFFAKKLPTRVLMFLVGMLIVGLSIRTLIIALS